MHRAKSVSWFQAVAQRRGRDAQRILLQYHDVLSLMYHHDNLKYGISIYGTVTQYYHCVGRSCAQVPWWNTGTTGTCSPPPTCPLHPQSRPATHRHPPTWLYQYVAPSSSGSGISSHDVATKADSSLSTLSTPSQ